MGILDFFNISNNRLKQLEKMADKVLKLEPKMQKLTDEELENQTEILKKELEEGMTLDDILIKAFATIREAAYRIIGLKAYKVQVMGGIALHQGNISEMKTGEGKTLAAIMPAYLNALTGKGVHIVTVNNYLAKRDKEEMGPIFEFLGLTVGLTQREMPKQKKKLAYQADITYGVNSEFGFDFLRDNLAVTKNGIVQKDLNFVIIDEIDSILIDDAKTPLIISGQGNLPSKFYEMLDNFVKTLKKEKDYEIEKKTNHIEITDLGIKKLEKVFGFENAYVEENQEFLHHLKQALRANYIFKKDKEYLVKDGEILIIDKYTGRALPGRRFSKGLHQALEAKENVEVQKESKTLATITYQNFFNKYDKISGMTGTAISEESEFRNIYGMEVIQIPTNKPVIRKELPDKIFKTKKQKVDEIVKVVKEKNEIGQPILIGAVHIDTSELISKRLKKEGISHTLLNAKQNEEEAEIISLAGQKDSVTIATNMAGRGTDIKISDEVIDLGGLFVLGVEKHEAKRIDNQLLGRCARQGDPGISQFFVSFEDKIFAYLTDAKREELNEKLETLDIKDDYFKEFVNETQQTVNSINSSIRQRTYEYEQIIAKQREIIYNERNKILNSESMKEYYLESIKDIITDIIKFYTDNIQFPEDWEVKKLQEDLNVQLGFKNSIDLVNMDKEDFLDLTQESLLDMQLKEAYRIYEDREEQISKEKMRYLERLILMKVIDKKWIIYLQEVDEMKHELRMHYTAKEPILRKYNKTASEMFERLTLDIEKTALKRVLSLLNKLEKESKEADQLYEKLDKDEKLKRRKKLEEKFEVIYERLPKISTTQKKLAFNGDINATEEIDAKINLYYLDDGIEKPLTKYCYEKEVDGPFEIKFELKDSKKWKQGWYQIRVEVLGEEAQQINFLLTDEDVTRKSKNNQMDIEKLRFFANDLDKIKFNLDIKKKIKNKQIKAHLLLNTKLIASSDLNIENKKVSIEFKNDKRKWQEGIYYLVLDLDEKVKIPFLVAKKHLAKNKVMRIPFKINLDKNLKLKCKVISIDRDNTLVDIDFDSKDLPAGGLTINRKKGWKKGRYVIQIISDNQLVYQKFILVE